jgi:hypothetical protein
MVRRMFVVAAALVAMIGAWQAIEIPKAAALTCCTYGVDCSGTDLCCAPGPNQANCSENPYYCQGKCSQ